MGGDGGVIASNRRYMRHAGSADNTGDANNGKGPLDPAVALEERKRRLQYCALSGKPLRYNNSVVACKHGNLYNKEAVIEALLRRKHGENNIDLGSHVRKLKDVYSVRFHLVEKGTREVPACPITGDEITGILPSLLLVPGKDEKVNVVLEKAVKVVGKVSLEEEYGPVKQMIYLAPDAETLKQQLEMNDTKKRNAKDTKIKTVKRLKSAAA